MNKILIISGPTATGKTALAVKIAKKYNGELISADSRQIYQGLDIGVGKDHPKDTPIHLIDVATPDNIFSVSEFRNLALPIIRNLQSQNKLPILVGCSGQYVDSIINPQPTYSVRPNRFLRFLLSRLPLKVLQLVFRILDFRFYALLNHSDINNPRRLIRKIELKLRLPPIFQGEVVEDRRGFDILHLSLTCPNSFLYPRIDARVEERLKIGDLDELKSLLTRYSWSDPGLKVSAYQVFKEYFTKRSDLQSCVQKWKYLEHRDARHQKTWFKKRSNINFIDISKPNYPKNVINLLSKWYNKS